MAYTNMGSYKNGYQSAGNYNDAYIKQNAPGTYQQIQSAKSAWEAAHAAGDRAGMDAAHQMAESLRAAYGYSGGTDGSAYIPNGYAAIRAQYQDAADAAARVYRQAAQQGAARLESQRPQIQANYDDLARQAYVNYMLEKRDLPQTMGRLGLQGQGAAESTAAQQSSAYQQNLIRGELGRQQALASLEGQISDVLLQGEFQAAQAQADMNLAMAQGYPDYLETQWQRQQAAAQQQQQAQRWQAEQALAAQKQQQSAVDAQFDRQLAVAKVLAQYGDFSGYASLGFNPDQIAQMGLAWQRQQQMQNRR